MEGSVAHTQHPKLRREAVQVEANAVKVHVRGASR